MFSTDLVSVPGSCLQFVFFPYLVVVVFVVVVVAACILIYVTTCRFFF